MTIYENIMRLTSYALSCGLIKKEDVIYTENKLLELFALDGFETPVAPELPAVKTEDLESILQEMLDCLDRKVAALLRCRAEAVGQTDLQHAGTGDVSEHADHGDVTDAAAADRICRERR